MSLRGMTGRKMGCWSLGTEFDGAGGGACEWPGGRSRSKRAAAEMSWRRRGSHYFPELKLNHRVGRRDGPTMVASYHRGDGNHHLTCAAARWDGGGVVVRGCKAASDQTPADDQRDSSKRPTVTGGHPTPRCCTPCWRVFVLCIPAASPGKFATETITVLRANIRNRGTTGREVLPCMRMPLTSTFHRLRQRHVMAPVALSGPDSFASDQSRWI